MSGESKSKPLAVLPPPPPTGEEKKPKEKIVEKIIEKLEQTYKDEKANEIQNIYNALVEAITSQGNPHIANILTALELVKHDLIDQKLQQVRKGGT